MPRYEYTARSGSGEQISAAAEVSSLPELAARLAADGQEIQTVRQIRAELLHIRGIPFLEIVNVYRQLASSLEAGMPLAEALEMLSSESRSDRIKSLLHHLRSRVSAGVPFSEAMAEVPRVFPEVHVAVVRSGEESGKLRQALDDLADQAEALSNMSRRFASALVYPTVIALAALTLFSFAFLNVVPKFQTLFSDLGIRAYPLFTRMAFFASKMLPVGILLLIAVAVLATLVLTQRRAASGRLWIDTWKLRLPLLGQIVEKTALARFSGMLGLLLESGVDLPRAIRLASEGAGNRTVERLLKNVSAQVETGESLGDSLRGSSAVPPSMAWRIGVGEETGSLSDTLLRMSKLYAGQVDNLVTSAAGVIEPALIIVIGSAVAVLVLGMFLPLVAVIQSLTGV